MGTVLRHPKAARTIRHLAEKHIEWIERRVAAGRTKASTLDVTRARYRADILPHLADEPLETFGIPEAEAWHSMRSQSAPIAANRAAGVLRAAWYLAELWGWVPNGSSPWRAFRLFSNPEKPRRNRLTPTQVRLLDLELDRWASGASGCQPQQRRTALAIALLLETGCRREEIRALRREDIHLEPAGESWVDLLDAKRGPRAVSLSDRAVRLFGLALELAGDRAPFDGCNFASVWPVIRRQIGAPDCTLHDLRRTWASAAGDAGIDARDAAALAGNDSIDTHTKHYRVLGADRRRELVNQASAALRGKGEAP